MSPPPYFATADTPPQERRRLLLVSYHFPPDPVVGARRWEKLSHYVAGRGWGLDVIMHRDPSGALTAAERSRLEQLPPGVRVYGVGSAPLGVERVERWVWQQVRASRRPRSVSLPQEEGRGERHPARVPASPQRSAATPRSIARAELAWNITLPRGWMRAYWAWLEFAKGEAWARDVASCAGEIMRAGTHVAVVTSGPPHMSHDAGRRIALHAGVPFVMDMRDPWRHVERLPEGTATPAWLAMARRHEARAVSRAALVVANTEASCRNLKATYPARADDIITVMNGADDDPLPPSRRGRRFVVAHVGTVYLDRDPRPLFQAAARVIRELALTPDDFGLEFIGELEAVGGFPIREVAEQEGISAYVFAGPPRPYAEAMQFMADATMLVTMSGANMTAIPAKTFECVRFEAWLLALSAPGSATDLLLRGTEADVVSPSDVDGITAVLTRRYREYRRGECPPRIAGDGRFSRATQARILLDAIQRLAHG